MSNFKTKLAKEYIPAFFPSGFPSLIPLGFDVLAPKQTVNPFCIVSAVASTNVFLASPDSIEVILRTRSAKSGLLSSVMASLASA